MTDHADLIARTEETRAYNAAEISRLERELFQQYEMERKEKLPQWARIRFVDLVRRIANLRAINSAAADREASIRAEARAEAKELREALANYVEALRELRSAGLLGGRLLTADDTARALTGGDHG